MVDTVKLQKKGRLPSGSHDALAAKYRISITTVKRLWNPIRKSLLDGSLGLININNKRKGNCSRRKKDHQEILDAIKAIHYKERRSLRSLQVSLEKKGIKVALSALSLIGKEN